jgi:hypothetical protein
MQAWNGIGNAIKDVITWVNNLWRAFQNLVIPAWLQPGSPTPFEMGLRGISSAMKSLASQDVPQFSSSLAMASVPGTASMPAGGGAINVNVDYHPGLSTANYRELTRELGPAVVTHIRDWQAKSNGK